jgi:glucose 1-dehydrogenase
MRAITVEPKKQGSAKWEGVQEPDDRQGSILVEAIAVGVCGTDVAIIEGKYGSPPPGKTRLILGHESLGRALETDSAGRFNKGDLVVGIVRRPDPSSLPQLRCG